MVTLTEAGAIVMPATPSFYSLPANMNELVDTVVNRVMDMAGLVNGGYKWGRSSLVRYKNYYTEIRREA